MRPAGFLLAPLLAFAWPGASAAESFAPRLYEVTTETGLPHLEENLRYATTRARLCLGEKQLASAFPILQHQALKGCRLDHQHRDGEAVVLILTCEGSETTGAAHWQVDSLGIRGTLDVRLGGKNMTFYQRMSGRPLGECAPGD